MKISYSWLKKYLAIDLKPEEVAEALTAAGLEVEDIIPYESVKGSLEGIITGEVVACEKHPNADKLSLTKVNVGGSELLSIVCGAPNVAAGQKVLVATVGTKLYAGEEQFEIKKSKIRGEVSEGMICAEDELGLGTSHDGIMVLDASTEIGRPASDYFNIEKDVVFEIGLTPNRSDAASHIGVARDLAAVLNYRFNNRDHQLQLPSVDAFKVDNHELEIDVEIVDTDACPRYTGVTLKNIKVTPSPEWLQNKLKAIGLRPINNVVDITNYVLFETGQPLHAFDADAIAGGKVIVRKLREGSVFVTLDEVERKLGSNDLMICNTEGPMCIGGVFGGLDSGVSEKTTSIFLESACFDAKTIRKTARLHGLQTDASYRFERGSDPEITVYALKRAVLLMQELAGGSVSSEVMDVYPGKINPVEVELVFDYLNKMAGQIIEAEVAVKILQDLGFELIKKNEKSAKFVVPTYKVDVYRPADLVEEVLRIYGYDKIAIPEKLNASINISQGKDPDKLQHAVADMMVALGFQEIMNNSLTRSSYTNQHQAFDASCNVSMLNPLSKDLDVLRQSLLFGGLETIAYNLNRKISDLKLFEFGKTYRLKSDAKNDVDPLSVYDEQLELALLITGSKQPENWNVETKAVDFYDLKFFAEGVLAKLRIDLREVAWVSFEDNLFEFAVSGKLKGKEILRFGKLNLPTIKMFDIKKPVFFANIYWEKLLGLLPNDTLQYQPVSKFPSVRRDLALVLDQSVKFEDIAALARKTETKLLQQVQIFDVYVGDKIATEKKSYAISFTLADEEKTLTDKLIDKTMQKLQAAFEQQFGAVLR